MTHKLVRARCQVEKAKIQFVIVRSIVKGKTTCECEHTRAQKYTHISRLAIEYSLDSTRLDSALSSHITCVVCQVSVSVSCFIDMTKAATTSCAIFCDKRVANEEAREREEPFDKMLMMMLWSITATKS